MHVLKKQSGSAEHVVPFLAPLTCVMCSLSVIVYEYPPVINTALFG